MQFGLFMMPLHPPHRAFADAYDRDIDQLVLADRLGFREAWVGEHITERWENAPAPDLLLAKALAMTERIMLGTGVTLLALHNPVYTAETIATLDVIARGNLVFGVGLGYRTIEFNARSRRRSFVAIIARYFGMSWRCQSQTRIGSGMPNMRRPSALR